MLTLNPCDGHGAAAAALRDAVRQRGPGLGQAGEIATVLLLDNVSERLLRPRGRWRLVGWSNRRWVVRRNRSIGDPGLELEDIAVRRRNFESQPIRIRELDRRFASLVIADTRPLRCALC